MVEISALKIRKGIYKFEVRKRFQHLLRYKVLERKPIDRIKDSLRAVLSPKKAEAPKAGAPASAGAAPQGGFNVALMAAAITIGILILFVGFLMWQISASQPVPASFKPVEKGSISNSIAGSDVLTSGALGSDSHLASVILDYTTTGLANYSVSVTTYDEDLPTEFFILDSDSVEPTDFADFRSALRKELGTKGMLLNEISMDQLASVPKGAALIIPSGAIPEKMLLGSGNITRLLDAGVVVIYIGQPFTSMLKGAYVTSTPTALRNMLPATFDESSPPSCTSSEISLFQPLYTASGTGAASSFTVYGCISVVKKGQGSLVLVPQTLDGGWKKNYTLAAKDIAKLAAENPWASADSKTTSYFFSPDNSTGEIAGQALLYSAPYDGTNRTVKLQFAGYSTTGMLLEDVEILRVEKQQLGELYSSQQTVTSSNITLETWRMNAKLSESSPSSPLMYVIFTDSKGNVVERDFQKNINTQSDNSNLDVNIGVDEGEYKLTLEDDDGYVYAAGYLEVASVSIGAPRSGSKQSIYVFDITTPVTLKELKVDVDNGKFSESFNDVSTGPLNVDLSTYTGGDALSYGNHTFAFTSGDFTKSVSYTRSLPPSPFPPELILALLLAGGIMGIGAYFARQEKIFYSIDIPDFPPVSRTKIPLPVETVLSIFEKVNQNYRWEFTPLTVTEVKNGFRDFYYQGNPVYISDYNTEFLLNELVRRKNAGVSLEYYAPAVWEKKSGRSLRYLSMLRRLRDLCVNNAVPFTSLGESKICDSEITVVGQQMFLHFFEKDKSADIVKNVLATIGKGITILLFRDNAEKDDMSSLLISSTAAPLVLKFEVENSSVLLLTFPELEKMVQEYKGV